MIGPTKGIASRDKNSGLIPRTLEHLYAKLLDMKVPFKIKLACLEIYQEHVYDLFAEDKDRSPLAVREHSIDGFFLEGARLVECTTLHIACNVLDVALKNRQVGIHDLNSRSSRSHCLTEIYVETIVTTSPSPEVKRLEPLIPPTNTTTATTTTVTTNEVILRGKMSLVDLAGSERLKSTNSTGKVLQEAGFINRSLYVLGKVIAGLVRTNGEINHKDVPYRDSKLTKLLISSLGGHSHTLMISCVSEAKGSQAETLRTLKFSMSCARIRNKPIKFLDPQERIILDLKDEIKRLKLENKKLRSTLLTAPAATNTSINNNNNNNSDSNLLAIDHHFSPHNSGHNNNNNNNIRASSAKHYSPDNHSYHSNNSNHNNNNSHHHYNHRQQQNQHHNQPIKLLSPIMKKSQLKKKNNNSNNNNNNNIKSLSNNNHRHYHKGKAEIFYKYPQLNSIPIDDAFDNSPGARGHVRPTVRELLFDIPDDHSLSKMNQHRRELIALQLQQQQHQQVAVSTTVPPTTVPPTTVPPTTVPPTTAKSPTANTTVVAIKEEILDEMIHRKAPGPLIFKDKTSPILPLRETRLNQYYPAENYIKSMDILKIELLEQRIARMEQQSHNNNNNDIYNNNTNVGYSSEDQQQQSVIG
jgi:hypothetical protein